MPLVKEKKQEIMTGFQKHAKDTGSSEVQIALITGRIELLAEHFQKHKKDNHSRRGLLMLVNKRRKLLNYLKSSDKDKYQEIISKLGLRK
ncbi:MAG: 30S ribosomal protein S15 [Candidatus Omnitrophica bacterium]|nr:30S ribosomal protein S15 [Candidatus Omnitrophota bacterium]